LVPGNTNLVCVYLKFNVKLGIHRRVVRIIKRLITTLIPRRGWIEVVKRAIRGIMERMLRPVIYPIPHFLEESAGLVRVPCPWVVGIHHQIIYISIQGVKKMILEDTRKGEADTDHIKSTFQQNTDTLRSSGGKLSMHLMHKRTSLFNTWMGKVQFII
jgi:hypothetical protein